MWDIEVDVACVGAGVGALASAVASADAGGSVLVAGPAASVSGATSGIVLAPPVGGFLQSWQRADLDGETRDYLAAVAGDITPSRRPEDIRLTKRSAGLLPSSAAAENFVGSRLLDWNAQCLASPYGLLYSSVSARRTTRMRTGDGQSVEVQSIGSITAADLAGGIAFSEWLANRARESDVDVREGCELRRIVFEDGRIAGIVLAGAHGPLAVRTRQGLAVSTADHFLDARPLTATPSPDGLQVCVVGPLASRFLRIELLEPAQAESAVRPTCRTLGRRLHGGAQALPSGAGSCGKLR